MLKYDDFFGSVTHRLLRRDVIVDKQQIVPPPLAALRLRLANHLLGQRADHKASRNGHLQQQDERVRRHDPVQPGPQPVQPVPGLKVGVLAGVLEKVDRQQHARDREERLDVVLELGYVQHDRRPVQYVLGSVRVDFGHLGQR